MVVGVELRRLDAREDGAERGVVGHLAVHLAEATGVPELVAEILATLDPVLLEADVLPLRRDGHDAEAQAVGAVLGDEVERVRRVAEGLRHLATLLVADDAGEIDVLERDPPLQRLAGPHKLQAGHDHARDPEENDVRARDERRGRVEVIEASLLHRGLVRPAERGEGPKPRRGPSIEHVVFLHPILRVGRTGERDMHLLRVGEVGLGERFLVESLGIPDRDAVAPPDLAADAPVLDVLQPVQVDLGPAVRVELDVAVAHGGLGLLDARILEPPLPG